jgi:hypothetical protein
MTEPVEPHAVVFRCVCPLCERRTLEVVTIPKLTSGEYFPQFARCDTCDAVLDFKSKVPLPRERGSET